MATTFHVLISCYVMIREEMSVTVGMSYLNLVNVYTHKGVLLTEINFDLLGYLDVFDSISLMMLTAG